MTLKHNQSMLAPDIQETLQNIADHLGRKLPELNKPADQATRWEIHHFFNAYEMDIMDKQFKGMLDDPATGSVPDLSIMKMQCENIRQLEISVFAHVNSLG